MSLSLTSTSLPLSASLPSMSNESTPAETSSNEKYDGDFLNIFGTRDFVDKTDFIRAAFVPGRISLITAPSKFGKTNNLLMLQDFFSYEAENNNLEHYKNLNIYKDTEFFQEHFRAHPVLFIDFCAKGTLETHTYKDAFKFFKKAISKAFRDQPPFIKRQRVESSDRKICRFWCDKAIDEMKIGPEKMFQNLRSLVSMMRKTYGKEVIVLIDNYDSVLNKTLQMNEFSKDDFRFTLDITNKLLNILFTDNSDISSAVVTGVSSLITKSGITVENLDICTFLGHHRFVEYFGITRSELDTLLNMEEHKDLLKAKERIKKYYGGYNSRRGAVVLNPYSVMRCLKSKKITSYWDISFNVDILLAFVKSKEGTKKVDRCLRRSFLRLNLRLAAYRNSEIVYLKYLHSGYGLDPTESPLFIPYFFDLGLFSYTTTIIRRYQDGDGDTVLIIIPNDEVYSQIKPKFQSHVCDLLKLPNEYYEIKDYMVFVSKMNSKHYSGWFELFDDYSTLDNFEFDF